MSTKVPDLQCLARGELRLLAEDDADYQSTLASLSCFRMGLADESTWRHWNQFHQVELWQAAALQLHMDPNAGPWESLGILLLEEDRLTCPPPGC